jgi:DHA1 family tetracycline resistance protein-like MFS transporter
VGLLVASWSVAQFFAAPVIGMLSDRFGRRPVILISVFGLAADLMVMALAPSVGWLLAGRVLCGLTAGAQAAAMAYVADITPLEGRAKSYGWLNAAAWSGMILGPALGGVLGAVDPRAPFWAAAAVALANGLYGLAVLPESLPKDRRGPLDWRQGNPLGSLALLASRKGLLAFAGAMTLLWLAVQAINSVFVLYTAHRYGWTALALGGFLSWVAVANIGIQSWLAAKVADRFGPRRTVLGGLSVQAFGFLAVGLAPTSALFWIANLPITLGNVAGPSLQAMMSGKVDPTEQGRLQGAMSAIISLTGLVGPILFTQAFAWAIAGPRAAVWSGAPMLLAGLFNAVAVAIIARDRMEVPRARNGA